MSTAICRQAEILDGITKKPLFKLCKMPNIPKACSSPDAPLPGRKYGTASRNGTSREAEQAQRNGTAGRNGTIGGKLSAGCSADTV